jgi:SagB-type dehydrogenase family enzyme
MLKKLLIALIIISFVIINLKAGEDNMVKLPDPQKQGGMPLMEALNKRKTIRDFKNKKLSEQTLSNLLWAAFGINRPNSEKRTAPSAVNWQEIEIYVSSKSGVYLYNAQQHALEKILDKDVREQTGTQDFVDDAAINLVFVADYTKMGEDMTDEAKKFYSWCDTGYISQNVYLFCASEGLATVVRGMVDREQLRKIINLKDHQRIVLAQTVGYPK